VGVGRAAHAGASRSLCTMQLLSVSSHGAARGHGSGPGCRMFGARHLGGGTAWQGAHSQSWALGHGHLVCQNPRLYGRRCGCTRLWIAHASATGWASGVGLTCRQVQMLQAHRAEQRLRQRLYIVGLRERKAGTFSSPSDACRSSSNTAQQPDPDAQPNARTPRPRCECLGTSGGAQHIGGGFAVHRLVDT
jgi:hypothetical protein